MQQKPACERCALEMPHLFDCHWVKILAFHVRSDSLRSNSCRAQATGLDDPVWDVVFIKVEQSIQESLWILQDLLLACLPVIIILLAGRIRIILLHRLQLEPESTSPLVELGPHMTQMASHAKRTPDGGFGSAFT